MRFDWYAGSVDASPERLIDVLSDGQDLLEVNPFYGNKFFRQGAVLARGDVNLAFVLWDNVSASSAYTHFESQGLFAPDTASRIRSHFQPHRVTRADVCEDFNEPGSFETILQFLLDLADRNGLNVDYAGDWHRGERGRTVYIGSRTSSAFIRFYEKGKQLGLNRHWVRLELQVNPSKESREKVCNLSPPEFFGCTKWSIDVGEWLHVSELKRVNVGTEYAKSSYQQKLEHCMKQYGNTLLWLLGECLGDEADFGQRLVKGIYDVRAAERQRLREKRSENLH